MEKLLCDLENEMIDDALNGGVKEFEYLLENWEVRNEYQTAKSVVKALGLKLTDSKSFEVEKPRIIKYAITSIFANKEVFERQNGNVKRLGRNDALNVIVETYRELEKEVSKKHLLKTIVMLKNFMILEEIEND
ncbi:hypothetical protein ACO1B2_10100 [Staphylococcus saprophyticus]|uniref:hypothetical protein n=1 Tax=Staphylococcus saprophyticus TaxID=29385 RepID=UPI003BF63E26